MEIGKIQAGLVALRYIRFPFLTFPVAFALWFMPMDIAPLMMGGAGIFGFTAVSPGPVPRGGLMMATDIYYRNHASTIESALMRVIPPWIQRLLPPQRS